MDNLLTEEISLDKESMDSIRERLDLEMLGSSPDTSEIRSILALCNTSNDSYSLVDNVSKFDSIHHISCQLNKIELKESIYALIPLGWDCLPRTIMTRWKIKKTKKEGELSCPFDLVFTPFNSVYQLIQSDFEDFLNPEYLVEFTRRDHKTVVKNIKYDCIFNHEVGEEWTTNDFSKLIKRYEARIENFYTYIKTRPVLFLLHLRVTNLNAENLFKLYKILEKKFPTANLKLAVINTSENNLYSPYNIVSLGELGRKKMIFHYHLPIPKSNYVWHSPRSYKSEAGLKFEYSVQRYIRDIIFENY